jgi:hypothetical protein
MTIFKMRSTNHLGILVGFLALSISLKIFADSLLVSYSLDEKLAEVGPDTYEIFQHNIG